jgi:hypothetical protein
MHVCVYVTEMYSKVFIKQQYEHLWAVRKAMCVLLFGACMNLSAKDICTFFFDCAYFVFFCQQKTYAHISSHYTHIFFLGETNHVIYMTCCKYVRPSVKCYLLFSV